MIFEIISELVTTNTKFKGSDIDTVNGFLYVTSGVTAPGTVTKIRLSDFTENSILTISSAVATNPLAIDVSGGFLYVGADSIEKIITKIRLSDFVEVGTLTGTQPQTSVCKDLTNGFIYFGEIAGIIDKINLSTFTKVSLDTGVGNKMISAVIDVTNGFAYFGTDSTIVRIRLSDFTTQGTINIPGIGYLFGSVIDTINGFAYFSGDSNPGRVAKIKLSNFTLDSILNVSPNIYFYGGTIDTINGFAYFYGYDEGIGGDKIVQIDLSTFTRKTSINIDGEDLISYNPTIDLVNKFAYFPLYSTNKIIKIEIEELPAVTKNILGRSTFSSRGASVSGGIACGKGKKWK